MDIEPKDMGAFRGKLRHLRNIGIPHIPKPGRGQNVTYSNWHALEMFFALRLQALGIGPRNAVIGATTAVRQIRKDPDNGEHLCLVIDPDEGFGIHERSGVAATLDLLPVYSLMKFAEIMEELQGALERAAVES